MSKLLHISWFVVTSGLLYVVYDFDQIFHSQDQPLATLVAKSGGVNFRYADINLWHPAEDEQVFYRNEIVATTDGARAEIYFDEGTAFELGENSQILIEEMESSEEYPLLMTLLRGELKSIKVDPEKVKGRMKTKAVSDKPKKSLALKAGSQIAVFDKPSMEVTIKKVASEEQPRIQVASGSLEVKDMKSGVSQKMSHGKGLEVPLVNAVQTSEPEQDLLPQVSWPVEGRTYWTFNHSDQEKVSIPVDVKIPPKAKTHDSWRGVVGLAGFQAGNYEEFSYSNQQSKTLFVSTKMGPTSFDVGYRLDQKPTIYHSKNKRLPTLFKSFQPFFSAGVAVSAESFSVENSASLWIDQLPMTKKNYELFLANGQTLQRLAPWLSDEERFSVEAMKSSDIHGRGSVFLGENQIIARMKTKKLRPKDSKTLMQFLNANLAFKGATSDLLVLGDKEFNKTWRQNKKIRKIYMYHDGQLRRVSKILFLRNKKNLSRLLKSKRLVLFKNKVDILGHRK